MVQIGWWRKSLNGGYDGANRMVEEAVVAGDDGLSVIFQ